jgi:hypothetical protein
LAFNEERFFGAVCELVDHTDDDDLSKREDVRKDGRVCAIGLILLMAALLACYQARRFIGSMRLLTIE